MATLILDIETIGESWNDMDDMTKHSLTRWMDRVLQNNDERIARMHEMQGSLGLSPFTGSIVSIGLYDVERKQGVVYYHSDSEVAEFEYGEYVFRARREKEMLLDFWDGVQSYDTFVTFGGRSFDVPFLNIRSAVHNIRPVIDLMEGRYLTQQKLVRHVDLQDQFSYYGAVQRRVSLHVCTRAFRIESPHRGGVKGEDVAELFHAKKFRDIAEHNAHTTTATHSLYQAWLTHLAPYSFMSGLENI